jgi:hypothetical protein
MIEAYEATSAKISGPCFAEKRRHTDAVTGRRA